MARVPEARRPTVTICIPASRDANGLRTSLGSVLAQEHEDLEVVITDDSCGVLAPVVEEFADQRVRYHANPRPLGLAGNHIAGLGLARGRHIGFLHDDDRFLPTYVSSVLARFEEDPTLGIVFSDCWIDRGQPPHTRREIEFPGGRYERFLPQVIRYDRLIPSTTVMRREVWDRSSRSWPDLVVADVALYVDAALAGWPFHYLDEPLVVYRKHPGQIGAAEARHRDDVVAFWDSYRFEDPEAEQLRRAKVAYWLVARAGAHLKQARQKEAVADLDRARRLDPATAATRRRALGLLASQPILVPIAHRLWRRVRPGERTVPLKG